jgi:hypothetical protein
MKSVKDIDMAALNKDLQQVVEPKKRRGWFRRNWRWFVPALLLTIVVVGGGALYWFFFVRVYNLKVCQDAMQTIAADKGMRETLGELIQPVRRPASIFSKAGWQEIMPNARVEKDEIDVIWTIEGPKKQARAHLLAKRRQGRWDTVMLEVTPAGGKRVSIQQVGDENDAPPPFQGANPEPPKPAGKKPETKASDINIDLPVPPSDAPAGDAPPATK